MIITGGIGLYLDSSFNIVLMAMNSSDYSQRCFISIFTTCSVHYLGYLSLVFRAQRVRKVMRLERKYLDEIYEMNGSSKGLSQWNTSNTHTYLEDPLMSDPSNSFMGTTDFKNRI